MERLMQRNPLKAVAYFRTSSATNVGEGKDSLRRQQEAVHQYAHCAGLEIVAEYYDAAVSGADPIDERPAFADLLAHVRDNGVSVVLVEDPTRFARDLAVQLTGHEMLKRLGVELVPANCPEHFRDDTPTAVMVRQILGAVSQFEKAQLVRKLRAARERTGRLGGGKPVPAIVVAEARRLGRRNPKTGQRRSLRAIAAGLAKLGHVGPSGRQYGAESIKRMLAKG
jgi:DNA invertase Pin-like site-specific DNA recombinase